MAVVMSRIAKLGHLISNAPRPSLAHHGPHLIAASAVCRASVIFLNTKGQVGSIVGGAAHFVIGKKNSGRPVAGSLFRRRATGSGWRVTDGGWRVTDGGWRVTDTDGGPRFFTKPSRPLKNVRRREIR